MFIIYKKYPLLGALCAQLLSLILIKSMIQIFHFDLSLVLFLFLQLSLSTFISQIILKLPKWFFFISIIFPLLCALSFTYLHIPSWIYGLLFGFFALTFSHTLKERVPLYLTNKMTDEALLKLAIDRKAKSFVDLGSGLGGVVRNISQIEKINAVGVESAPVLWLISSSTCLVSGKGKILRKNIWDTDLADFEIAYAFLSPAIMEKLFKKIKLEMKPGSLFISNSFAVKDITPNEVWELDDKRKTKLFLYNID